MADKGATQVLEEEVKDDELEELLDSAFKDFGKPPVKKCEKKKEEKDDDKVAAGDLWGTEFLKESQTDEMKLFEEKMKELFSQGIPEDVEGGFGGEAFDEQLQKIAEEANKVFTERAKQDPDFSATISMALKNLTEETENIRSNMGPEALSAMLNQVSQGESGGQNDFLPLMQSMMQSFLSKEVFYPSIKDITEKYPHWLEQHKNDLPEKEYENYNKQYHLMEEVCVEFEKETENDSEDVKKSRFAKILSLLEEMQKLGMPPKEFTGYSGDGPPLPFNENGLPTDFPAMDPNQCVLM